VLQVGSAPAAAAPQTGILQTISDFMSLGANTVREVQEAIRLASGEAKQLLEQINTEVTELLAKVSDTYQANLYITIDSLDQFTRNKLLELQSLFEQVVDAVKDTVAFIGETILAVLRQVSLEIRRVSADIKRDLEEVILVGGITGSALLDRATNNALTIAAFAFLGIGLLLFIGLLLTRRMPTGPVAYAAIALALVYLVLFGSLALVPSARAYAMKNTGIGLREQMESVTATPRILDIFPQVIIVGTTKELEIWGSGLRHDNVTPTVRLQSLSLTPRAASNDLVVVDVAAITLSDGSSDVILQYNGQDGPRAIVRVARTPPPPAPADLIVTGLTIDPPAPLRGGYTRALVTIRNQGMGGTRKAFKVTWKPTVSGPTITNSVPALDAGVLTTVAFEHTYLQNGTFDTIATVDALGDIAEVTEANNTRTQRVTVNDPPARRARATVTFLQMTVHEDAKPISNGRMWLALSINGQKLRWPTSGTVSVVSGQSYSMSLTNSRDLAEGEPLSISITGWVDRSLVFDASAVMGMYQESFQSSAEWGKGIHDEKSTCKVGCYELHFRIDVVRL
jgi:hypothetical protein